MTTESNLPEDQTDASDATVVTPSADADESTIDGVVDEQPVDEQPVDEQPAVEEGLAEDNQEEEKTPVAPVASGRPKIDEPDDEAKMDWYILKVQSNRESSICDGLRRRVAVAGLDEFFGEILVPTEDVAEFKNGKRKIIKRKLYPGYIVAHMVINDETWFLVRETPGIGDFTGAAGKPTAMLAHEVERIVKSAHTEEDAEVVKTAIPFNAGDRVRIKEGTFENFEGDVDGIDEANGRVTVMINIFGRSTPVELEHWQVEAV